MRWKGEAETLRAGDHDGMVSRGGRHRQETQSRSYRPSLATPCCYDHVDVSPQYCTDACCMSELTCPESIMVRFFLVWVCRDCWTAVRPPLMRTGEPRPSAVCPCPLRSDAASAVDCRRGGGLKTQLLRCNAGWGLTNLPSLRGAQTWSNAGLVVCTRPVFGTMMRARVGQDLASSISAMSREIPKGWKGSLVLVARRQVLLPNSIQASRELPLGSHRNVQHMCYDCSPWAPWAQCPPTSNSSSVMPFREVSGDFPMETRATKGRKS